MAAIVPVVIRRARHDELERLIEIEIEAGAAFADIGMPEIARDDPGSPESLAPYVDAGHAWVAVDADDRAVAYLISSVVDGCAFVEQVSVAPAHARRGLGSALIDHLQGRARTEVLLTTFRDVPWNAPYYRRLGFEVVDPHDGRPELAALVERENARIPGDAPRVAMSRPLSRS
jgi:ribosomal protein S18 acetylase RimI-like enzyme